MVSLLLSLMCGGVVGIERAAFPDRSARQASRAAWRQSQCVASGRTGTISALSGSVSSSSSLSSLGPSRPLAGPITSDTRKSHITNPLTSVPEKLFTSIFVLFFTYFYRSFICVILTLLNFNSRPCNTFEPSNTHKVLVPLLQALSSASKGQYRPLSPRVGAVGNQVSGLKPRQVIVSSPGSPSSSSDSQSGSDSVKHCLPGRVSSPAMRASPSPSLRQSPSVTLSSSVMRNSPSATTMRQSPSAASINSPGGARHSPSITSISRAAANAASSRSSSPAMQASSAGLAVTLSSAPAFTTLSSLQTTISNINTTANNIYSLNLNQGSTGLTYASTNPFLTGAYMHYTPPDMTSTYVDKYNTIGSGGKDVKYDMSSYTSSPIVDSSVGGGSKYNGKGYESSGDVLFGGMGEGMKYNTIGGGGGGSKYDSMKSSHSQYYSKPSSGGGNNGYDPSSTLNVTTTSSGLLGVEDTPTPTSSIETEDSTTREVGEKDVEGDGEQSD